MVVTRFCKIFSSFNCLHRVRILSWGLRDFFYKISIRYNLDFISATFWLLSSRPLRAGLHKSHNFNVVLLSRPGGVEDIVSALDIHSRYNRCNFFLFPRSLLKIMFFNYIPRDNHVDDYNYNYGLICKKYPLAIENYLDHFERVFAKLKILRNVDAFLSFNLVYYPERDLPRVLKSYDVKWFVLQKEGLFVDVLQELYVRKIVAECGDALSFVDHIFVYSDSFRELVVRHAPLLDEIVSVCGAPRIDSWFRAESGFSANGRVTVLYYAVGNMAGMFSAEIGSDLTEFSEAVEHEMTMLARKFPEVNFIFKHKVGSSRPNDLWLGREIEPNISLVDLGTSESVLGLANVVIGYNTTGLFESLAAGKIVIDLGNLNFFPAELKPFAIDLGAAVINPESFEEIEAVLGSLISNARVDDYCLAGPRQSVLEKFMGNNDGSAGRRLLAELGLILERDR